MQSFVGKGIQVIDLLPTLSAHKSSRPVFLKQDTHWTPAAMEISARQVAESVQTRPWFESVPAFPDRFSFEDTTVAHTGDLVENLGLCQPGMFPPEPVEIHRVIDPITTDPVDIYDTSSPVIVLGDSFTNIYHTDLMKWGSGAGFAEHLAYHLGMTLDTIAQNGQGSTGVRQTLATRRVSLEGKRAVVWALAERDLFLSEAAAKEAGVEWQTVNLTQSNLTPLSLDPMVVEAELIERSPLPDPLRSPYPSTLYAAKYRILRVIEGDYDKAEILIYHWGYRDRTLLPSARYKAGDRRTLTLVPFESKTELRPLNRIRSDDYDLVSLLVRVAEFVRISKGWCNFSLTRHENIRFPPQNQPPRGPHSLTSQPTG